MVKKLLMGLPIPLRYHIAVQLVQALVVVPADQAIIPEVPPPEVADLAHFLNAMPLCEKLKI